MRILGHTLQLLVLLTSFVTISALSDTLSDGYINGQVSSTMAEPIAGVIVRARSSDTPFEDQVRSDERGFFRFPLLRPGQYTLDASIDGFADARLESVIVKVGTGTHVVLAMESLEADERIEEIIVVASSISKIDLQSSETTLMLSEAQIDILPVNRDATGVAMLAPGTVRGDGFFNNFDVSGFYPAFGGSSVAENAYYINGMNITNFRNGLGGNTVPFEFIQEFQIKYSGISAEYGRATGGFVNALTKRGTNDFKFGVGMFYESKDLSASSPTVIAEDGTPGYLGKLEGTNLIEAYVYASGPVVRDKLYFYALYNPRDFESTTAHATYVTSRADDAFWGLKLDFEITDNHLLEFTAFSDEQDFVDTRFNLDVPTQTILDRRGDTLFSEGGQHWVLKYSGNLHDTFTISALVGQSDANRNVSSDGDEYPVILDSRAPEFFTELGSWESFLQSTDYDKRDIARFDIEWRIGRHLLHAGVDQELNSSFSEGRYSGDNLWIYWDAMPGDQLPIGMVPSGVTQVTQHNLLTFGGSYDIETTSWYFEDSWQVTDAVMVNVGVRNETFDNRNANGETFIKMTDQWAPRIGVAWDVFGDGSARLYGSFGRYHLPVASNTNIHLGGATFWTEDWWVLDGLNADDTPQLGAQIGTTVVFADGEIADPDSLIDRTIKPMYQDEYTIGFEKEIGEGFKGGIVAIRRDLVSTIEDILIDAALNDYAQENGYLNFMASGIDYFILTNPGTDLQARIDLDFDGIPETIDLNAESLGFPKAERKYSAVNLFLERIWDGDWFGRADYIWSKSYGNYEGYVRSDNGQTDAGLTTNFDLPSLMKGAYGDLPNDRRHSLSFYGAWRFRPQWTVSTRASWTSGRSLNTFSFHPTDPVAAFYGPEAFFTFDGEPAPRASRGETPSVKNIDMSLTYEREVFGTGRLTLQLDIFNIFNWDSHIAEWEWTQFTSGLPDSKYRLPRDFQAPRSARISARLDF